MVQVFMGDNFVIFSEGAVISGMARDFLKKKYPQAKLPLNYRTDIGKQMVLHRQWEEDYCIGLELPEVIKNIPSDMMGFFKRMVRKLRHTHEEIIIEEFSRKSKTI